MKQGAKDTLSWIGQAAIAGGVVVVGLALMAALGWLGCR